MNPELEKKIERTRELARKTDVLHKPRIPVKPNKAFFARSFEDRTVDFGNYENLQAVIRRLMEPGEIPASSEELLEELDKWTFAAIEDDDANLVVRLTSNIPYTQGQIDKMFDEEMKRYERGLKRYELDMQEYEAKLMKLYEDYA